MLDVLPMDGGDGADVDSTMGGNGDVDKNTHDNKDANDAAGVGDADHDEDSHDDIPHAAGIDTYTVDLMMHLVGQDDRTPVILWFHFL
jgi:hypothetical protein